MSAPRTLGAIEAIIGPPEQLEADGKNGESLVRAVWECGCEASGLRLTQLELAACDEHRASFG